MDTRGGGFINVGRKDVVLTFEQYTPVDTVVFGGNFLHSYNVDMREWDAI